MKKKNLVGKSFMLVAVFAGIVSAKTLTVNASEQDGQWSPRTVEQIKADIKGDKYTIVWGDTLGSISQAFNISVDKLQQWNSIANADLIYAGNEISVKGNVATIQDKNGETVSQTIITNNDKNDATKPIGNGSAADTTSNSAATQDTTDQTTATDNTAATQTTDNSSANTGATDTTNDTAASDSTNTSNGTNTGTSDDQNPNQNTDNSGNNNQQPDPKPVTEKVLGVPFISQGNTMLCEGTSLLEALHYKGVTNQDLYSFVNSMPIASDNNPYNGYSGEWRHNVSGTYQGMMAAPVVSWAAANGGNAVNITGAGTQGIKNEIKNGNPVVAWVTYQYAAPQFKQMPWGNAVWNGHVVCVDGFRDGAYHIVDPVFGASWVNASTFEPSFNTTGMAVAVR
ncbi:C39 family peptidase [Enterococcus faecium]